MPAEASECAADQGKFWDYSELLFKNQRASGFTKEELTGYAAQLNMDTKAFGDCVDSRKHKGLVEKESDGATRLGITSTPTFLLNGKPVKPQKSYDELIIAAKAELAKLKK